MVSNTPKSPADCSFVKVNTVCFFIYFSNVFYQPLVQQMQFVVVVFNIIGKIMCERAH